MSQGHVKRNASRFADQLLREAQGLEALRVAARDSGVEVPQVLQVDERRLALTRIEAADGSPSQWQRLGRGLAAIHAVPQERFGWETDNYIGLNPQLNGWSTSWSAFFVQRRLGFQVSLLADARWRRGFAHRLQAADARLRAFLDAAAAAPSLVHGDLWRGNVLCGADGRVWLIDPAVYVGDAEVDLAMSEMFGGFPAPFVEAYRALRPDPPEGARRRRIYNLYHYLNHLNLFGPGYLEACEEGFEAIEAL